MQKKNILIVEDDHLLRKVLVDRFHKEMNTIEAEDGEKAVERAEAYKPDLILLDLLLPKLNGFKVLESLRSHQDEIISHTPVIVLSNLYSNEDILEAERLTITAYLVKAHTDLDEVEKKVKETLGMIL
jgi:DNA-binding response OmpR family regulator